MNREILFKAKRKDNGEWVEGYMVKYPSGKVEIFKKSVEPPDVLLRCEVDPKTICEYTGLKDKNGKEIWENDIVKCLKRKEGYELYQVVWRNEFADFGVKPIKPKYGVKYPIGLSDGTTLNGYDYRALGDIFDNPELLEVR